MIRLAIVALLSQSLSTSLMAGERTSRFEFETCPIRTDVRREPLRVTFKLDTMTGTVWRYAEAGFVHVPVDPPWSPTELEWPRLGLKERQRREETLQKLHDTLIPEISFKNVPLQEALISLAEASRANDPEGKGVGIALDAEAFDSEGARDVPIHFEARHISLQDALDILCRFADLRMRIRDGEVMMVPCVPPGGGLVRRMFVVEPDTTERLRRERPDLFAAEVPAEQTMAPWKAFFSGLGVSWPDGSSVEFIPSTGRFVVASTYAEVERFERALRHLNHHPSHPGRFRLAPLTDSVQTQPTALLMDTVTGDTWIYEIGSLDDAGQEILTDGFLLIPQRLTPEDWNPFTVISEPDLRSQNQRPPETLGWASPFAMGGREPAYTVT